MKSLIWKEWQENLKWVPLPGLVILLVFLIDRPIRPMPDVTQAFFYALTAVVFGTALGFVQIFFEAHGDKRSLLMHRPLSPSRIFLAKAIAGVVLYVVALGIPFLCLERWLATPGRMPAPYHWPMSRPWLADILSGLVYYFAGMLVAQREVRWYGSRGLALAAAFFCSYLVWILPEFWQALVAIVVIGSLVGVAAWGSFCSGGAYAPQCRLAKAALALSFLAGLLIVSMLGKQVVGEWLDSGMEWEYNRDRQGRVLMAPFKETVGAVGPWIDLHGKTPPDLKGKVLDSRNEAPSAGMETPLHWSYRNSGRFYVECTNDSKPDDEMWFYDQSQKRLVGFDDVMHQSLGSFGPDGFTPPGLPPGERFRGELLYRSTRWQGDSQKFLAFSEVVYLVNFYRRTIRSFFTPAAGETVAFARWWNDPLDREHPLAVVSTNKSIHFLTDAGSPVVSLPRDSENHKLLIVGVVDKVAQVIPVGPGDQVAQSVQAKRYFVWYHPLPRLLEPQDYRAASSYVFDYDAAGHMLEVQTVPPPAFPKAPYAEALFGLATPLTEAATLVGASQYLRSQARLQGSKQEPLLLDYLENSRFYIPGTAWFEVPPDGLIPGYISMIFLSAMASALSCFLLARRYTFSRAGCTVWALVGFFFGWVGLLLMLALQEWPARISCPKCRRLRVVTRNRCEHCGAGHAGPATDGTEIFDPVPAAAHPVLAAR